MTKLEILYSIIECSTFGRFACEELSRSGSEAEQGCSSASGGARLRCLLLKGRKNCNISTSYLL